MGVSKDGKGSEKLPAMTHDDDSAGDSPCSRLRPDLELFILI